MRRRELSGTLMFLAPSFLKTVVERDRADPPQRRNTFDELSELHLEHRPESPCNPHAARSGLADEFGSVRFPPTP